MENKELLEECTLCTRNCKVNIFKSLGVCKASEKVKVARAELHPWEEPPISFKNGSGTVFFSHCNLKCVFCQNHEISQDFKGLEISIERLAEIFLELQEKGAENINLVTPTHYAVQIIEALKIAKEKGLSIPILYNTNGYDSLETIKLLDGYIDVYLPDFKYFKDDYAIKYSKIKNYKDNLIPILDEMFRQVGSPKFSEEGKLLKGMIIRHLMLPGLLFDSKKVIDTIFSKFGDDVYISIMNQYTPMNKSCDYPEINKPLNPKHYESLIDYAASLGVRNAFIQESGTNSKAYVPSFKYEGVMKK